MGKRTEMMDLAKPTASVQEISVPGQPEVNAAYIPVDVPLAGSEGPDIRNVHIRLTARQAVAYRRLRAGLVSLGERLDNGRLVDDTIRGEPVQWLLERIAACE